MNGQTDKQTNNAVSRVAFGVKHLTSDLVGVYLSFGSKSVTIMPFTYIVPVVPF